MHTSPLTYARAHNTPHQLLVDTVLVGGRGGTGRDRHRRRAVGLFTREHMTRHTTHKDAM
jgi:hypothetical protein